MCYKVAAYTSPSRKLTSLDCATLSSNRWAYWLLLICCYFCNIFTSEKKNVNIVPPVWQQRSRRELYQKKFCCKVQPGAAEAAHVWSTSRIKERLCEQLNSFQGLPITASDTNIILLLFIKKLINNSNNVLYFRLLRVATLCFVFAANTRPSLNEPHYTVTWESWFWVMLTQHSEFLMFRC